MAKRRPSGDGMVRKREDGRWEGRIVVGHKENGEPIFRYVLAKTQKELLAKLHRDMDLYQDAQLTEDSRMTLGEWLDRWMEEYGAVTLRPNTLRSYEQYIRCYHPPAGQDPTVSVDPEGPPAILRPPEKGGTARSHRTIWEGLVRSDGANVSRQMSGSAGSGGAGEPDPNQSCGRL